MACAAFTQSGLSMAYLLGVARPHLLVVAGLGRQAGEEVEMPNLRLGRSIGHGGAEKSCPRWMSQEHLAQSIRKWTCRGFLGRSGDSLWLRLNVVTLCSYRLGVPLLLPNEDAHDGG
jgi:hypothetical protein